MTLTPAPSPLRGEGNGDATPTLGRPSPAPGTGEGTGARVLAVPSLAEIIDARKRITGAVLRTPLVRLNHDGPAEIWLKLENLQPIGSFKIRGPVNAMRKAGKATLKSGVYTASAGNHAQGLAWAAREMGVPCTIIVPTHAPETKVNAITRMGATVVKWPLDDWWKVIQEHRAPNMAGRFIHPAADPDVIAANGTVGLEILEDLPDVDTVLVPWGGGGLACGISAALRHRKSKAKVYACEVETAAPLTASLKAGSAQQVDRKPSFIDGMGGKGVLPEMFPLAKELIAGTIVCSVAEIAGALKLMVERNHVVAEGAGAAPVAAALSGKARGNNIVCIVSGGNIDAAVLARILNGETP